MNSCEKHRLVTHLSLKVFAFFGVDKLLVDLIAFSGEFRQTRSIVVLICQGKQWQQVEWKILVQIEYGRRRLGHVFAIV